MATTARPGRDRDYTPEVQVYEPHRTGLPKMAPYFRELWRRRQFAYELSRSTLRAQHFDTAFGQVWLVINPLLLAAVYYVLVDILSSARQGSVYFAHLLAGLFAYYFVSGSISSAANSVVGGGRLILNTSFPRALLPLGQVLTAFMRFVPTLVIYAVAHVLAGLPLGLHLFWAVPIIALMIIFASGIAMAFAAMQVYFRDLSSLLPYLLRIWLYLSPVLFFPAQLLQKFGKLAYVNPLYAIIGAWGDTLTGNMKRTKDATGAEVWVSTAPHTPDAKLMLLSLLWAVGVFAVGLLFFMSREREFAVRL